MVLRVCRPHPEVASFFRDWLSLYADERLKEGAVVDEPFGVWLDTTGTRWVISMVPGSKDNPTATIFVSEDMFWALAARSETLFSAFITGKPIVTKSKDSIDLRDLTHVDALLTIINKSLVQKGIDLASLVASQ